MGCDAIVCNMFFQSQVNYGCRFQHISKNILTQRGKTAWLTICLGPLHDFWPEFPIIFILLTVTNTNFFKVPFPQLTAWSQFCLKRADNLVRHSGNISPWSPYMTVKNKLKKKKKKKRQQYDKIKHKKKRNDHQTSMLSLNYWSVSSNALRMISDLSWNYSDLFCATAKGHVDHSLTVALSCVYAYELSVSVLIFCFFKQTFLKHFPTSD